jgi:hypothetical protein
MHTIHQQTICALLDLQTFLSSEIKKHTTSQDDHKVNYYRHELAKIESLESFYYDQYHANSKMTPEEKEKNSYLGDGVYIERTPSNLILRTGSSLDRDCDNTIYLEPKVVKNLLEYISNLEETK